EVHGGSVFVRIHETQALRPQPVAPGRVPNGLRNASLFAATATASTQKIMEVLGAIYLCDELRRVRLEAVRDPAAPNGVPPFFFFEKSAHVRISDATLVRLTRHALARHGLASG